MNGNKLELTEYNLIAWKQELNIEALKRIDVPEFSENLSDEEWLEYIGDTPEDMIDGEIDAMRGCI